MLVATVSTCKTLWLFATPWFMLVATVSACKPSMFSQLHAWCLWRQRAAATNINHGTANHECVTSAGCRHKHKSWSWEKTTCFTSARCRHDHQSWSCEQLDALHELALAPSINPGAAKNWMLYNCWLSKEATGWFTSNKSKSKSTSNSGSRSRDTLDVLPLLAVATRCLTSDQCRHTHQSCSCEILNALQVLTVAVSINPESGVGAWSIVANTWSCEHLDVLQVLAVATNINHGTANTCRLYKCWLSPHA